MQVYHIDKDIDTILHFTGRKILKFQIHTNTILHKYDDYMWVLKIYLVFGILLPNSIDCARSESFL